MRQTDRRPRPRRRSRIPASPQRYDSLTAFYRADERRVHSRERDVGLWWREQADGPLHRAAWVSDTGELYLVRLGPVEQGGGRVEILATVADGEQLERLLEGWRERCGEPRSLSWLRERARHVGGRARAAHAHVGGALAGAGALLAAVGSLAAELA
jgi:hypothetical protein